MLLMVAVLTFELRGIKPTHRTLAMLWLVGACLALGHSFGALFTFHHGSQTEALESTAQQTEKLLGFRFAAGLYINYLFVLVWMLDAVLRLIVPARYDRFPSVYRVVVLGFLVFIAINGAVVFKEGWMRTIGVACVVWLATLFFLRRRDHV
jgi:hypothetical protein